MKSLFLFIGILSLILSAFLAYSHFNNFLAYWAGINGMIAIWVYDYLLEIKIKEQTKT